MKPLSLLTILFVSVSGFAATQKPILDSFFQGKWYAVSNACLPGSLFLIDRKHETIKEDKDKPFHFSVISQSKNADHEAWLKTESTYSKFMRLKNDNNQLEVDTTDRDPKQDPGQELGLSSCWYGRKK
jgi:hypothetical protein